MDSRDSDEFTIDHAVDELEELLRASAGGFAEPSRDGADTESGPGTAGISDKG